MTETTDATDPRSADMKIEMADHFESFEYEYREDDATGAGVVYEDDQVVVVADHTGHELNEWANDFGMDRSELSEWMHAAARDLCEYDWSVSDPVVFDKADN